MKDDGNHLGLGLAIAKRIVELHGSELCVASLLKRGTRFSFELPARIAAARDRSSASAVMEL